MSALEYGSKTKTSNLSQNIWFLHLFIYKIENLLAIYSQILIFIATRN